VHAINIPQKTQDMAIQKNSLQHFFKKHFYVSIPFRDSIFRIIELSLELKSNEREN
jgi:hypothetical protein